MPKLQILDSGVIYRNTNPGYEYAFACHSSQVEVAPGQLLCAFQKGQALYSVDSVCLRSRSRDGGKTWTAEPLLHNPARDAKRYSYHGPLIARLSDGTLLITAMRIDRSDPNKPLFNEKTGGIAPSDTILMRSRDGGATWSEPEVLEAPTGLMLLTPSCPAVELRNGKLLQAFDQWHGYDDPGPYRPRTIGLFSSDGGRTWGDPVTFADGAEIGKGFWHGRIIRLRDDRLFTLFWSGDMKRAGGLPLHYCIGDPSGRDWSEPQPTNIPGQTNWPVDLGDGRMVAIYTVREAKPPGFFITFSEDGGKSWNLKEQLLVWDASGRDKIGIDAPESYPRSHDTIAFGAPNATLLSNGEIFATFWCTEMSVTQIRYARLRLA